MLQVVWLKKDIRIRDHAPLYQASLLGPTLIVYVFEPSLWTYGDLAVRHRDFLLESLEDLNHSLKPYHHTVYLFLGEMEEALERLHTHFGPFHLHAHKEHGLDHTYQRDKRVAKWLQLNGCRFSEYSHYAVKRGTFRLDNRSTFTEAWLKKPVLPVPKQIPSPGSIPEGFTDSWAEIKSFALPGIPLIDGIRGGESRAIHQAKHFFDERFKKYNVHINKPHFSWHSSSLLSAHITFGNVSLRQLHKASLKHLERHQNNPSSQNTFWLKQLESFYSRLFWHDTFMQRIEKDTFIDVRIKDPRFKDVRKDDLVLCDKWLKGETGIPYVDACMKALHHRGWLNFRQRAVMASFAMNVLLLDWRRVGTVLAHAWMDYEPAIHWNQIQMQGGLLPQRHIPMYDVIKQAKQTDPEGLFVKTWCPALKTLNPEVVHEPWLLDPNPYREPIIDLKEAFEHGKTLLYSLKK